MQIDLCNKLIFAFGLLLFTCVATASFECKPYSISDLNSKENILNQEICFETTTQRVLSKNCLNKKCPILDAIARANQAGIKLNDSRIVNGLGNPGYKICEKIGGTNQYANLTQVFKAKDRRGVSLCVFKNDNSFCDLGSLMSWSGFR